MRLHTVAPSEASDEQVRGPLWAWPARLAKAVMHERRRRFGIEDERIDPSTLADDEDEEAPQ